MACQAAVTTARHLQCPNRSLRHLPGLVSPERPGQAEIRDLGAQVRVQEDVAGLEVTVDDPQPGLLVEVQQAARDPAEI